MVDNKIVSRIAEKIRTIRQQKKLTINQLAERTNVTKGLLSKIENSRTIPSLPVFVQILQSLGISFKDFFEDLDVSNKPDYIVIRKSQHTISTAPESMGVEYRNIVEKIVPSSTIDISLLNINPQSTLNTGMSRGFQFKYLVSGKCEYHFKNGIVQMTDGDSIYFDTSVPCTAVNTSDKTALLFVITMRH